MAGGGRCDARFEGRLWQNAALRPLPGLDHAPQHRHRALTRFSTIRDIRAFAGCNVALSGGLHQKSIHREGLLTLPPAVGVFLYLGIPQTPAVPMCRDSTFPWFWCKAPSGVWSGQYEIVPTHLPAGILGERPEPRRGLRPLHPRAQRNRAECRNGVREEAAGIRSRSYEIEPAP